jgi:hypothetical protein
VEPVLRHHHVPELGGVVRRGAAFQQVLRRTGQVVAGGVHVANLRLADGLAMPCVHDVGKRDVAENMSVGQPRRASR